MEEILKNIMFILLIINLILLLVTQIVSIRKQRKWEKQIDEDLQKLQENNKKFFEEFEEQK